jgi:hypothetical protein
MENQRMKEHMQLNDPEIREIYEGFMADLKGKLFEGFDEAIKETGRFTTSYKTRFDKVTALEYQNEKEDLFEYVQAQRNYKKELLQLIEKHTEYAAAETLDQFFEGYFEAYSDFSSKLQSKLIRKEKEEKYKLKPGGNPVLLTRKLLLNLNLWAAYRLSAGKNILRKLFKKPPIDYTKYRSRHIPLRQMAKYYLTVQLFVEATSQISTLMKGKNSALMKLWKTDEQMEVWFHGKLSQDASAAGDELFVLDNDFFDALKGSVDAHKKEVHDALLVIIDKVFIEFEGAVQKVDTIDLSRSKFHPHELELRAAKASKDFTGELKNWSNSTTTLFDDWSTDSEITLLYYSVFEEYYKLNNKLSEYISKNLTVNFKQLEDYISESNKRLAGAGASSKNTKALINKERETLKIELIDNLLTKTVEKLTGSFITDIDKLKSRTLSLTEEVSDKRSFAKNSDYLRGIKDSEISTLSPRELLSFEALPHFENNLGKIKIFIKNHLEKARINLLSLGTVSDFSLESAALLIDQKRNSAKKAIEITAEGYNRALNHLEVSIKLINEIKLQPLDDLKIAINELYFEIQSLKNTDNILELNLRIARINAIERSKKARRDAVKAVRALIPKGGHFIKTNYDYANNYLLALKSRFGISTVKTEISFEFSEFIRETESSLKKLPFVYQRLYQLKPTDEDRFFANRIQELDVLQKTYEDWQKDRFVSVAILGEKGSGVTSLINKFIRDTEPETSIIRETLDTKITKAKDYLSFFAKLLEVDAFNSNDEIVHYLNESQGYKIIIFENMHHLYMKQVGGFECLKMFFDLMSNTTRKVLWICGYTLHSWEFLDHTLKISDYYIRKIELARLSDKTIEDVIFRRNQLSGYKIIFEASDEFSENKAYMKLNDEEKQEYLRKEFFSNLNKSCNGNISLALLYWLRSTQKVDEESITIASLKEMDFSFVQAFSGNYLFTLHAILIHDGLTLEDYSRLFNITPHLARNILIPMLEKGLLIRPKDTFNINPLIFKQVIQHLRSKNFIN